MTDLWTNSIKTSFMAITAHYVLPACGHLIMQSRLVTFRHVVGSHTGKNLAGIFITVLRELHLLYKVS
jgi:hypothetical protein